MKLRNLRITRFGHFSDREILLSDSGLQLIYGPNEAGKTTLLEFLRGWLFDFPVRTPYDFGGGVEVSGSGSMVLRDGRVVEMRRRKGNKNKVAVKIDGQESGLDDVGFQQLLGNATRHLFEKVFAFGLKELAAGEELLQHENLQSALYGGGLGLTTSMEKILEDLEQRAQDLFAPRGKYKTINDLLQQLKDTANKIQTTNLRSDDYENRQAAAQQAEEKAAELAQRVEAMRNESSRAERLVKAYDKWWKLQQQIREFAELSVPPSLPENAGKEFENLQRQLEERLEEENRHTSAIADCERKLGGLCREPKVLAMQSQIRYWQKHIKSFTDAQRDLPELEREVKTRHQDIARKLKELRPGWTPADLEAFSVDAAGSDELRRLQRQFLDNANQRTKLRTKEEQLLDQIQARRAELDTLGEIPDVATFESLVADEAEFKSDQRQLQKLRHELEQTAEQCSVQMRKLAPFLAGNAASPRGLPVPPLETVVQWEKEFAECRREVRAAETACEQSQDELHEREKQFREFNALHAGFGIEDRDAARRRRDEGWRLVRKRYIDAMPAAEEEAAWVGGQTGPLADRFEQAVRDADAIADQIYGNADAVAKREQLRRQVLDDTTRLAHRQAQLAARKSQEMEMQRRWLDVWKPSGITPAEPETMRAWRAHYQTACELLDQHDRLSGESQLCDVRFKAFEGRLRSACRDNDCDLSTLLTRARMAVEEAREKRSQSKKLREQLQTLAPKLDACRSEITALNEQDGQWRSRWQALLRQLNLPGDWSTDLAQSVIGQLQETRRIAAELPEDEKRIASMAERIAQFSTAVRDICQDLLPDAVNEPPELVLEKLSKRLDCATEAESRHGGLLKELESSREQLSRIATQVIKLKTARVALLAAAGTESESEFARIVSQAERARELKASIEQLHRDIDLYRASDDPQAFEQELCTAEAGVLEGRLRDAREKLQRLDQEKKDADGAAAVAKSQFELLDGSAAAAVLLDERSSQRAKLAAEVDRYAPLVIARHLLQSAVKRFERDNQPEMLASVARLMQHMTGGRYTQFDRAGSDRKEVFLRQADGAERNPTQLSTGTREQLYLAIRLAYVTHYCRQNEPLPIVMDDVLVNFDDDRARQTLSALAEILPAVQILFFTCHPHMVQLAQEVFPGLQPVKLDE